ncbi:MAG: type II toxin-antitoxin system VapC family toxin [Actinobacteria bacterium]|nr:type II toxin-antitoxin system VapC family toxin [Actinomycetota bacterium]
MILCDVNVLVYAHKEGSPRHEEWRTWLQMTLDGDDAFGVSDLVLSGFLRVVTHRRIFDQPSSWEQARAFAAAVRAAENAVPVYPGRRHWTLFLELAEATGALGNALPDAYLAALAIESGCEWTTADHGFARYPGLRWRNPLADPHPRGNPVDG